MKKTYIFLTFLLMSSFMFAQVRKSDKVTFMKSDKVTKEINTIKNGTKAWTDSIHYDGPNADAIGFDAAGEFGVYMVIPTDSLIAHTGKYLNDVKLYINEAVNVASAEIRLYTDTNGAPVYTRPFTVIDGWNSVSIASYALPTTGYLVVGYNVVVTGGFPVGCDTFPTEPNGYSDLMYLGEWFNLSSVSPINCNFNIRAMIGDLPASPMASVFAETWNANTIIGEPISATFTLTNLGGGTLTCSGISGISAPFSTDLDPASVNLATGASKTFTITFTPTNENLVTQTATIATNGGDVTIYLNGTASACSTISTFPWTESFESFLPECWSKANPDGGTGWSEIAYGTTPLPGWTSGELLTLEGGGNSAVYCTWNTGGATSNDQWLISPQIAVQENQELSYYIYSGADFKDNLDVKISTTNRDLASFTTTLLSSTQADFTLGEWKKFTISLTAYAGQNIYIAFQEHVANNSNDGGFIALDLVKVDAKASIAENETETIKIYPNPANDYVKVYTSELSNITITDLRGSVVYAGQVNNNDIISTTNFESGLYIVTIETKDNISRTKLIIN
ncbi:MAG: T9SS type A sorting domain-containing protein [Bacteroidales bacterium]|nr:T9SS type A sorting domain-containing protein [Bacteroidales bacterium]